MSKANILNFDNYTFRAHAMGYLMTDPIEGQPAEKYAAACSELSVYKDKQLKKIEEAKTKRDEIQNKETKTYATAKERVEKLDKEFNEKVAEYNSKIKELEKQKDIVLLSETTKQYLLKIYIEEKTGRRDELINRYVKKGIKAEGSSMTILMDVDDKLYIKNTVRITDEFFNGECDINYDDFNNEQDSKVIDIKSPWDIFTFYAKTLKKIDKNYWWQLQIYMKLFAKKLAELIYVLNNTPAGLIEDEKKRLLYAMGSDKKETTAYEEGCKEIEFNSVYDDMPNRERVIRFTIKRDDEAIERAQQRVIACRKWLNDYALEDYYRMYPEERPQDIEFTDVKETVTLDINIETFNPPQINSVEVNEENNDELRQKIQNKLDEFIAPPSTTEIINELDVNEPVILIPVETPDQEVKTETIEENSNTVGNVTLVVGAPVEEIKVDIGFEIPIQHENPIIQNCLEKIAKCKSQEDCLNLYKEIRAEFNEHPEVKKALTDKKNSFQQTENPVAAPPPSATKQAAPPKVAAPPLPVAQNISPQSERKNEWLYKLTDACTKPDEVQGLYKQHKDDIGDDNDLKSYMTRKGQELMKKK